LTEISKYSDEFQKLEKTIFKNFIFEIQDKFTKKSMKKFALDAGYKIKIKFTENSPGFEITQMKKISYHPENVKHVSDMYRYHEEDIIALSEIAQRLGIQFKIDGIPFGASYPKHLLSEFEVGCSNSAV
jgi:hypothetical protein